MLFTVSSYSQRDTLLQGQKLRDGGQLLSAFGIFRLGFFGSRGEHHVGIWYNTPDGQELWYTRYPSIGYQSYRKAKMVWVANPDKPISDKSGVLAIDNDGNLKIFCSGRDPIALTSVRASGNTSATLLDNGNLVLRELNSDGSTKQELWQSLDYPTDTLLPGMRLGINLRTGHSWYLKSRQFTFGMDQNGTNELIIRRRGEVFWSSGNWVNGRFNLSDELSKNGYHFDYFSNGDGKYFTYYVDDATNSFPMIVLDVSGSLSDSSGQMVRCNYEYGSLNPAGCAGSKLPTCRSYFPSFYQEFGLASGDSFPYNESLELTTDECWQICVSNCSCVAFRPTNMENDSGCQIWSKVKIRASGHQRWQKVYFLQSKVAAIPRKKWLQGLIIAAAAAGGVGLISVLCFIMWRKHKDFMYSLWKLELLLQIWRRCRGNAKKFFHSLSEHNCEQEILLSELGIHAKHHGSRFGKRSHELQFFSFESIAIASNNFAPTNKLGEGGFGPVYKGKLPDGQEIAIKRLSENSQQGLVEFRNEVRVIAQLQHNNLVRLVGCCIEKEKILIYDEYMPNKSLDSLLFDARNQYALDWKKRFTIIEGIVQGLLYLHKYSRVKIIHRDLKASNVLLDSEMNPKISDFGMAKIFGPDETKANTNRVVGTFGYMSPEYAREGVCSTKALLLEIVSGRRNNSFHQYDGPLNLTVYAWDLWRKARGLELIELAIRGPHQKEALRCIHVGLLCIQENPMDRPTMLEVASMIYSGADELPSPKQPAFYDRRNIQGTRVDEKHKQENWSLNGVTVTRMEAR